MYRSAVSRPETVRVLGLALLASAAIGLASAPGAVAQGDTRGASRMSSTETDQVDEPGIDDIIKHRTDHSRIVGGAAATPGQWPSLVAIYSRSSGRSARQFCGGTVIDKEWVLTAAHCAAAMKREPASTAFFIREGTNNLNGQSGRDVAINANQIIIHNQYDPRLTLNDVALLKLSGQTSAPRQKLASRSDGATALSPGRNSTVAGFGVTASNGSTSALLLQVDVPIVAHDECRKVYGSDRITDAAFCAGLPEGGKDSCQGDSGGPLFIPHSNGEQMQLGVVSWGKGCALARYPGVYASVGQFQEWIKSRAQGAVFSDSASSSSPVQASVSNLTNGAIQTDKPSQIAQVTLDIAEGDVLKVDSYIEVRMTSSVAGSVVIYNENPDGSSYQLYPSKAFPAPGANPALARIEPGRVLRIPSAPQRDAGYRFVIRPPTGTNKLRALVVPESRRMEEIVAEHFDGGDIRDLSLVTNQIVDAGLAALGANTRGPKPVQVAPVNRGTAERTYQIVN